MGTQYEKTHSKRSECGDTTRPADGERTITKGTARQGKIGSQRGKDAPPGSSVYPALPDPLHGTGAVQVYEQGKPFHKRESEATKTPSQRWPETP